MKTKILVLCTGNSCRSQMAEGIIRKKMAELKLNAEVVSAGVEAHGLNPRAVKAMKEIGIDITGHRSELVDDYLDSGITHVLTVCDSAAGRCPIFPEKTQVIHHSFPDPANAVGTEEEIMESFFAVRDQINDFSDKFLSDLFR